MGYFLPKTQIGALGGPLSTKRTHKEVIVWPDCSRNQISKRPEEQQLSRRSFGIIILTILTSIKIDKFISFQNQHALMIHSTGGDSALYHPESSVTYSFKEYRAELTACKTTNDALEPQLHPSWNSAWLSSWLPSLGPVTCATGWALPSNTVRQRFEE